MIIFVFKYLILLMILVSSTSIGFLLSKRYKDRVNELVIFSKLIKILQNKIRFTKIPLAEAFSEISEIESNITISEIFSEASKKIKSKKCKDAWIEAIEENRSGLSLKKEDLFLIQNFGNTLGKTDSEGQISEINEFLILLQTQIKSAEEERKKNAKMYKSLGTIIGLAIVILIF